MHNTDRTQQYLEAPSFEGNFEANYEGNFEAPMQGEDEYAGEVFGEAPGAFEGNFQGEAAFANELIHPMTGEVNEMLEMQLAGELLNVTNEQQLEQFLGNLFKGVSRGFRNFARSGFGRMLGNTLRNVARTALPIAGSALGSLIPIPGVGTALGGMAANALGNAVGLEFEGMSNEDREFEVARRVVRFGIEGARALDAFPQGEMASQQEIAQLLGGIASRLLPGAVSSVLSSITGQAASGGQGSGGFGGGLSIHSPGGWDIRAGGSAGGQGSFGQAVGLNTQAPPLRVPGPGPIPNFPAPSFPGPRPGGSGRSIPVPGHVRTGRWIRRGRHILVLNAF